MEWTSIIDMAYDCNISIGTETSTCLVTIQLKDFAGSDLKVKNVVYLYGSSDAYGNAPAVITTVTKGTDGDVLILLATYYWMAISEDDGALDVTVDGNGTTPFYVNVVLPNGKVVTSEAITCTS